jgi:alpha-tubulin suppressor-like RCC1 family protein
VVGITGVIALAGGAEHSLALKSDGTVWAWGNDGWGQLGTPANPYSSSYVPVQVSGLNSVKAIAAGWAHSLALASDGTVWAWGYNYYGQTGTGTSGNNVLTPTRVAGLSGVVAIAAGNGSFSSLALKGDGTVWAWGYDGLGQLGNGTSDENPHPTPVKVTAIAGVSSIGAGSEHALAVRSDGTVWAWGDNSLGQLGAKTTTTCSTYHYACSRTPVQVKGLLGATAVAGGGNFSLAIKSDQTAWGWGDNGYGQLGNGKTTLFGGVSTPVQVKGLTGVVAIAAGASHSLAIKSDGTAWAWGYNGYGQVGNGTFSSSSVPVPVTSISGLTVIGAGQNHSLAE